MFTQDNSNNNLAISNITLFTQANSNNNNLAISNMTLFTQANSSNNNNNNNSSSSSLFRLSNSFLSTCLWSPTAYFAHLESQVVLEGQGKKGEAGGGNIINAKADDGEGSALVMVSSYEMVEVACVMDFQWFPFDEQVG